jgi:hypothetical protein
MTLAKAKAKTKEIFIVQASLTIVTYYRKNMFIVQATGFNGSSFFYNILGKPMKPSPMFARIETSERFSSLVGSILSSKHFTKL